MSAAKVKDIAVPARWRRRREIVAWTLAGAAVVLAIVFFREHRLSERRLAAKDQELEGLAAADNDRRICLRELAEARASARDKEAALALVATPGTQLVQLEPQSGDEPYRATVLLNREHASAIILVRELEPQEGKSYQLWLIRGDEKIAAGILRTDPTGALQARISQEVLRGGRPDAFAVTVEPEGGMPQPTGPTILLGKVPAA